MILVTGVSGFIGKRLLSALVREHGADHILALTSKPITECRYLLHHNYNFTSDYLVKSGYDRIETILHAGAFTPKNGAESNDIASCSSNINNTYTLLQLELPALKKFIFLSSLDVYGIEKVIDEQSPVDPLTLYGQSKLYCEKMIAIWAKTHHILFHLLRVGHIYGPGEEAYQKLIPATINKLLAGDAVQRWGAGNEIRSFLFIDSLIAAIQKVVNTDDKLGTVNLVSGTKISVREIIDMLIEISGIDAKTEQLPATSQERDLVFDNSKMLTALGHFEIPLREGLAAEWKYMKQLYK